MIVIRPEDIPSQYRFRKELDFTGPTAKFVVLGLQAMARNGWGYAVDGEDVTLLDAEGNVLGTTFSGRGGDLGALAAAGLRANRIAKRLRLKLLR